MAVKHMPMSSLIIGVDLDPIRAIKGCKTLVGDITTQKSRQVHCSPCPTHRAPPHSTPLAVLLQTAAHVPQEQSCLESQYNLAREDLIAMLTHDIHRCFGAKAVHSGHT